MAKKEKKRPVAHQEVIRLLKEDPLLYLGAYLKLYQRRTAVPSDDCLRLGSAILDAAIEVKIAARIVIEDLEKQRKESKDKKKIGSKK